MFFSVHELAAHVLHVFGSRISCHTCVSCSCKMFGTFSEKEVLTKSDHFSGLSICVKLCYFLLRDRYMHSASLLSKDGWLDRWNDVRHMPVLCLNG